MALTGCADTPDLATQPSVEPPRAPASVPATKPAPPPPPVATQPVPEKTVTTQPSREPTAATKPSLKPIVVSEDGLIVEGQFSEPGRLEVGWIEIIELIDAGKPGAITARQKLPRSLIFDTQNVKRLRIDFRKSKLSPAKTIIIRPDGGRGIEVSQKRGRVLFFERSQTGRWGIDRGPKIR